MKLTKEKAIQLSYELWKWMKDNKKTTKDGWPGWEEYGNMCCMCPCCQYEQENRKGGRYSNRECVKHCPLLNIWPVKRESACPPCCRKGSPFYKFEEFEFEDEKRNESLKIVSNMEAVIKKEMKRLKIKPLTKVK